MKNSCPNCDTKIKPFSMKMVRTDNMGRNAGELGWIYICPHCQESLVRNKHKIELIAAICLVFIPFFIGYVSVMLHSRTLMVLAGALFVVFSIYSYYQHNFVLASWQRWIRLNDYLLRWGK